MDRQVSLSRTEMFSFVNPWIRYFLFFFSFLFWVSEASDTRSECCFVEGEDISRLQSIGSLASFEVNKTSGV